MRLNDPLVTSFEYKGKEYSIDLSFDNVLDVFDVFKDKYLRFYEKADICLNLLLNEEWEQEETIGLFEYIFENFIATEEKEIVEYDLLGNPLPKDGKEDEKHEPVISIEQDAEYIFASFKQAYGMNLFHEQGKLHWHEFRALLNGLPADTSMQRIIQIRQWKPSKYDSEEHKKEMRKLQKYYELNEFKEVDDEWQTEE